MALRQTPHIEVLFHRKTCAQHRNRRQTLRLDSLRRGIDNVHEGNPNARLNVSGDLVHGVCAQQDQLGSGMLQALRRGDQQLADVCRSYGAEVLTPEIPPPEMKVSVQLALRHLQERYHLRIRQSLLQQMLYAMDTGNQAC